MNGQPLPKEKDQKEKAKPIGTWQKECDALTQEIGQAMNPFCLLCGKACQVMHHFIPKSVSARLRYEWSNLVPLCNGCHHRLHQSGDPDYEQRIITHNGRRWYNHLQKIRRQKIQVNISYYRDIKLKFINLRNEVKSANLSSHW